MTDARATIAEQAPGGVGPRVSASSAPPLRLVVLVSGRGSNLRALWHAPSCVGVAANVHMNAPMDGHEEPLPSRDTASDAGPFGRQATGDGTQATSDGPEATGTGPQARGYCVAAVISDQPDAPALAFARAQDIPTEVVRYPGKEEREAWNRALLASIQAHAPDVVVLAGFMKVLGPNVVAAFPRRILNVHPSLLPAFPGLRAPEQALKAGARVTGCTVHWVDEGVDTGPVLAQEAVPVQPSDDAATLHTRIQAVEHRLLPDVLERLASGVLPYGAR